MYLGETAIDHIWAFIKQDGRRVLAVSRRYTVNHSQMRLNGVKDAFKIGMLPDFFIKNVLQNNEVVEVPSDGEIKGNYAGVIAMQYAQKKYMPSRLKVFTEFVTAHLMKGSFNEGVVNTE